VKKFYSIEEVWEHYFPKDTAARRDRELRERDPEEWNRRRQKQAVDDLMKRIFG
jgi:hypothetical protein